MEKTQTEKSLETDKDVVGVEALNAQDQEKERGFFDETQVTVERIEELADPENLIKLSPEKRKIVLDKVKALMLVLVALGVYVAYKDLNAMEAVSDTVGPSKEAMIGFAGTITALVGAIGYGFRNAYNKFKRDEYRQNPQPETI